MYMKSGKTAWALLAPTLIILGLAGLVPFFYVLYVGFFEWTIFAKDSSMFWTGSGNYRELVFDYDFLASLGRSLLFTTTAVVIEMSLGLLLAHLLLMKFKCRNIFRAIHALPLTVAPIAVGASWRLLTIPGMGLIPYYLNKIGIDYNIGNYEFQAFFTVVLMDVWHWIPFVTLTMLAGLSALPRAPIESAMIDGASRWQIFRHITIPLMRPVIMTALFLRIMDTLRIVDEVYMLTKGGPGMATRFVGIHIWRVTIPKTEYGYGSAMSVLILYFTIVLCWLLITAIAEVQKRAGK